MSDEMPELKPCPFCGSRAELRGHAAPEYWVGCTNNMCEATGYAGNLAAAIERWNLRTVKVKEL